MAQSPDELALINISGHRMRAWCNNQSAPFVGGGSPFERRTDFVASLIKEDWDMLGDVGMGIPKHIIDRGIDWNLLNAVMAFWNPQTQTFFFPTGEMAIFQEELTSLLNIQGVEDIEKMAVVGLERWKLDHMSEGLLTGCMRGDLIDLHLLWNRHRGLIMTPPFDPTNPEERVMDEIRHKAILIIFGGIFFFSRTDYRIPHIYAALLAARYRRTGWHLVHPILACLNEGLSTASLCGEFSGSPWVLQEWLFAHFPFIGPTSEDGSIAQAHRRSVEDWLTYFSQLTDSQVIFAPYQTQIVTIPRTLGDLYLIGARSCVVYTVSRCCRMLGYAYLSVDPAPSLSLIMTRENLEQDLPMLGNLLGFWNTHSFTVTLPDTQPDARSLATYLASMRSLVPVHGSSDGDLPESSRRRRRR